MYNAGKWKHVESRKSQKKYTKQKFTSMDIGHWTMSSRHAGYKFQLMLLIGVITS